MYTHFRFYSLPAEVPFYGFNQVPNATHVRLTPDKWTQDNAQPQSKAELWPAAVRRRCPVASPTTTYTHVHVGFSWGESASHGCAASRSSGRREARETSAETTRMRNKRETTIISASPWFDLSRFIKEAVALSSTVRWTLGPNEGRRPGNLWFRCGGFWIHGGKWAADLAGDGGLL